MSETETIDNETATSGLSTSGTTSTTEASTGTVAASGTWAASASEPAQVVYVGPRLRAPYPVGHMTIFRGALPAPLAGMVTGDEDFAACFVPVDELGRARPRLRDPDSALARSVATVTGRYLQKKEG